jgi:chemotaxis protein CheX
VCGVTGQIQGSVIYGMSLTTADQIASAMIGQPIKQFDQLAASAIAELGNMISGNAMLQLSEAGFICDITPPTVIRGSKVEISTLAIPAVVIPLEVTQGDITITVGLQTKK